MKVTLERATLLKSLGHVHRVVERRNTIAILSNVLLHAQERTLTLKATDLDLEVEIRGLQHERPVLRVQKDIGENCDGVAPFDGAVHVAQRLQQGRPFERDFHGGPIQSTTRQRAPGAAPGERH